MLLLTTTEPSTREVAHEIIREDPLFMESDNMVSELDFELCFTEHEDASAWSGLSLQALDQQDDWESLDVIPASKSIPSPHQSESSALVATDWALGDFEEVEEYGLGDLLVDIIVNGIRSLNSNYYALFTVLFVS